MHKPFTSNNPFFLVPFVLWVVTGGLLLLVYGDDYLFRVVNLHSTTFMDAFMPMSTMLGEGVVIALVLLSLMAFKGFRNWWYFLLALLCNVLPPIIVQVFKRTVSAPRPLKFFQEAEWIHILPDWPRLMENSFPSGHTTGAFCFFTFLSFVLPAKYRVVGLVFFLCALLVAYSRIYLAVHFFADVYVGSIIGTSLVTLFFAIMNHYQSAFFKKV